MGLFSYIVARDYGFAPNPFYGTCTLATCKPVIRGAAEPDDWIVGIGSASHDHRVVYFMQVDERITYNEYWNAKRFRLKRPNLHGSRMMAFGDNIYHRDPESDRWVQQNSHHSNRDGSPNLINVRVDTSKPYVLASRRFTYFGKAGPHIPDHLQPVEGETLLPGRGHKRWFSPGFEAQVVEWLEGFGFDGCVGEPRDWKKTDGR